MSKLLQIALSTALVINAATLPGRAKSPVGAGEPALLTFDELVRLYENPAPAAPLAEKLNRLLATPFVVNSKSRGASAASRDQVLRVAQWNIERGIAFEDIEAAFKGRAAFAARMELPARAGDPKERDRALEEAELLKNADIVILNEVDWGLKRSEYRNVAKELATTLGMNYAYGVEFVEVDPVTLGLEKAEEEKGDGREELLRELAVDPARTVGLHGNAILSRYPLSNVRIVRFQTEGHDWFEGEKKKVAPLEKGKREASKIAFLETVMREVRRGGRMMLLADIEDPRIPGGKATIVNAHLEAKTKPSSRRKQMEEALAAIRNIRNPVILAGDLNTSGSDSTPTSIPREVKKRLGSKTFWVQYGIKWATGFGLLYDVSRGAFNFGRVYSDPTVMDIKFVLKNPEAQLFNELEDFRFADGSAFDFRGHGARSVDGRDGTLANSNERAAKGFKPTFEPERSFKVARLKLDWIFVKPVGLLKPNDEDGSYVFAPQKGRTLQALNYGLEERISDHNPIMVDIPLTAAGDHPDAALRAPARRR